MATTDPIEQFWAHIAEKLGSLDFDKFEKSEPLRNKLIDGFTKAMQKIHPDLVFEFGRNDEGKGEFCVSAGGIRALHETVLKVVARAPQVPNWTISAFRQRAESLPSIQFGDVVVGADKVLWTAESGPEHIDLQFFLDLPAGVSDDIQGQLAFLFLDQAIGEEDVMVCIGPFEWKLGAPKEAAPLLMLAAYVDQWKAEHLKLPVH